MTLARVGEIELDFERTGSGAPLLAIMGMSGTYLHWGEPFLGRLRESFEVIGRDTFSNCYNRLLTPDPANPMKLSLLICAALISWTAAASGAASDS